MPAAGGAAWRPAGPLARPARVGVPGQGVKRCSGAWGPGGDLGASAPGRERGRGCLAGAGRGVGGVGGKGGGAGGGGNGGRRGRQMAQGGR